MNIRLIVPLGLVVALSCKSPSVNTNPSGASNQSAVNAKVASGRAARKQRGPKGSHFPDIVNRTHLAGIEMLESKQLSQGESEIRIWMIYAFTPAQGVVLNKHAEAWTATHLRPINPSETVSKRGAAALLPPPKSGGEGLWDFLLAVDIFHLPDAAEVFADNNYPDATAVVIETKTGVDYHAVKYSGPDTAGKPEAIKVLRICQKVFGEFNLTLPFT